ncbi:hypothetical protein BH23ACT9_BH23ACT9_08490 [soil metagenome]
MEHATPRLRSITGVARALITTVGIDEAVAIVVAQFGWDTAFVALANLEGEEGGRALWLALTASCEKTESEQ